jgi:hypothetical protein
MTGCKGYCVTGFLQVTVGTVYAAPAAITAGSRAHCHHCCHWQHVHMYPWLSSATPRHLQEEMPIANTAASGSLFTCIFGSHLLLQGVCRRQCPSQLLLPLAVCLRMLISHHVLQDCFCMPMNSSLAPIKALFVLHICRNPGHSSSKANSGSIKRARVFHHQYQVIYSL